MRFLTNLISLHIPEFLEFLRKLNTPHMRPRLQLFRLSLVILPSDKLTHHKRRIHTLIILELCMIKRTSSQNHILINSLAPASQIASFSQFL